MTGTLFPEILWAQRSNAEVEEKNVIYLTIRVFDVEKPQLTLNADSLEFAGDSESHKYAVKINFFKEIDVEKSHQLANGRGYFLVLRKKEKAEEFWPRLTKEKIKYPYIRTDFDRWVDEDEQEEETEDPAAGLDAAGGGMGDLGGDFDFSQFTQQLGGGAGGPGGFTPDVLKQLSAQQEGALEDQLAEESLDSIGERINPLEGGEADDDEAEAEAK